MTEGLTGIIAQLERQRLAIDKALEALREIEGTEAPRARPTKQVAKKTSAKSARDRRSEGQRKRWAAKKAAAMGSESTAEAAAQTPDKRPTHSRVTPEGRQKLADAMKKRWAAKRAAATKTSRKTRAAR